MSFNLNSNFGVSTECFKGSSIADRTTWAIRNSGDTKDTVAADGTISSEGLNAAIAGLNNAIKTTDANNANQKQCDQNQINFFQTLLTTSTTPIGKVMNLFNSIQPADGTINNDTTQSRTVTDCGFLSTTRALSTTVEGKNIIKKALTINPDGSYDVKFPGADKSYHVTEADLTDSSFIPSKGDKDMSVLEVAANKYFADTQPAHVGFGGINVPTGSVRNQTPEKVMQLYTGGKEGVHTQVDQTNSVDDIKKFLIGAAPNLGKNQALTLTGTGDQQTQDWIPNTTGDGHAFNIKSVQYDPSHPDAAQVSYTNPWDTSRVHTISLNDLATKINASKGSTIDSLTF